MEVIQWIKLDVGFFGDDKIKQIRAMPEGDAMLLIWLNLLVMAGKVNDGGLIYLTQGIPYTDEMFAVALNRPLMTVRCALETFTTLRMIERTPDGVLITNWEKHQNIDGMERAKEKTKNRVRRFRERQRANALLESGEKSDDVTPCNADVTPCNADVTVQNKNKNKKEDKDITYTAPHLKNDTNIRCSKTVRAGASKNKISEGVNGGESDDQSRLGGTRAACETESSGAERGGAVEAPGVRRKREKPDAPLDWRDLSKDRLY